jgi:magnesium transporter
VITVFVHDGGRTRPAPSVEPAWLRPESGASVWVDLAAPTPDEARVLRDVFRFHELAVEDALSQRHHPKIEAYDSYLYLILHGIDFEASRHRFATHDTDFFLGPTFLVTVHGGNRRSIADVRELCARSPHVLAEGPAALMHRIVDAMVDHYEPEADKIEDGIDALEREMFEAAVGSDGLKRLLGLKQDVASLRRVTHPQRDAVARLARREFLLVGEQVGYRFRDVYDHLVRLSDQATAMQDRVTGLLEAHLSHVSNRLNAVMKVLTVIATIFMPLTVLTGLYGMNVTLPGFPGGEAAQFWWIMGIMVAVSGVMLWVFRRRRWL